MAEEPKKISFGFSKLTKKPALVPKKNLAPLKNVQLIDCLEGQSIKVKDAIEIKNEPLVIPIKESSKNLLDRVKEAKEKSAKARQDTNKIDDRPDSELTLDELAARELLREAQKQIEEQTNANGTKIYTLPVAEDKFVAEGEAEATLDDYENVPINDFGMAMLRGMGWSEASGIGKNPKVTNKAKEPELRPKGLGLGADKMAKVAKAKIPVDKNGEELQLIKGAYAKIIAGNKMGNYCEVQGLDDEACRVIVKTAIKGEILTLNEFLVVPVSKDEYIKSAKVINNVKYNAYKEQENSVKVKSEEKNNDKNDGYVEVKREDYSRHEVQKSSSSSYRKSRSRSPEKKNKYTSSKYKNRSSSEESRGRSRSRSSSSDRSSKKKHKKKKSKKSKKSKSKSKYRDGSSDSDSYDNKKKYGGRHNSSYSNNRSKYKESHTSSSRR